MTGVLEAEFSKRFAKGPLIQANLRLAVSGFGVTVLFGPSGAGKTTVLRCLAGLERPDSGHIHMADHPWFDAIRGIWLPPQQREIGYLSQDYALFPHLRVGDNITYGLPRHDREAADKRGRELLALLGLNGLEHRYPRQLSGGQQQRVALARAVARQPRLLLLDEPLSALDVPTRDPLRQELRRTLAQMGMPTIVVTHDLSEALTLGDNLAVMDQGRVCQIGPAQDVVAYPCSQAVARIVGFDTMQAGTLHAGGMVHIGGVEIQADGGRCLPGNVLVCIRAENVRVAASSESLDGSENRLAGVVAEIAREGHLLRVRLDCGFTLIALISPHVAAMLKLHPGAAVVACFTAADVHLIPT